MRFIRPLCNRLIASMAWLARFFAALAARAIVMKEERAAPGKKNWARLLIGTALYFFAHRPSRTVDVKLTEKPKQ